MLDQMQIIPMHDLSPLLTYPEFALGVRLAQDCFPERYELEPLTEDEMIDEVEEEGLADDELSCLYHLGFVYGTIDQGLTSSYTPDSDLSALLTHPEFLSGVENAQFGFLNEYEPAPLTEEEMIMVVENTLSRRIYIRSKRVSSAMGEKHPSYIDHLGYVFGIINEGLTYSTE